MNNYSLLFFDISDVYNKNSIDVYNDIIIKGISYETIYICR